MLTKRIAASGVGKCSGRVNVWSGVNFAPRPSFPRPTAMAILERGVDQKDRGLSRKSVQCLLDRSVEACDRGKLFKM